MLGKICIDVQLCIVPLCMWQEEEKKRQDGGHPSQKEVEQSCEAGEYLF